MSVRRGRRPSLAYAAALLAVVVLAGCGDDGDAQAGAPEVQGVGEQRGFSSAALAQCADWREGTRPERLQTIEDLRGQLTPQTGETDETGYPDEAAYALFQRVCAQEYASGFRLYKVYAQAAAFAPLTEDPPDE